jgi:hypothetical protein
MIPCLFSVSYAGLWGQATLSLPDFFRKAQQLGYPTVMLMAKRPHLSPLDASDEMLARWKGLAGRCSLCRDRRSPTFRGRAAKSLTEMQIAYVESVARRAV